MSPEIGLSSLSCIINPNSLCESVFFHKLIVSSVLFFPMGVGGVREEGAEGRLSPPDVLVTLSFCGQVISVNLSVKLLTLTFRMETEF